MFKAIVITNYKNEELNINFFNSDTTGFNIRKIDGLGPVKADIATTKVVTSDGDIYNSARANSRNIVITLGFKITPEIGLRTIEDCRQKTYKYFPLKKILKFTVITDNRTLFTYGYVESNEPDIWSKDETTNISIICPSPWFLSSDINDVTIKNIKGVFKFPFEVLEEDLPPKDIYGVSKPDGLFVVRESKNTSEFYGNDIYNLYDNKSHYLDLEHLRYSDLIYKSYNDLTKISPSRGVIIEE